jgi:hypothetical protein
MTCAVACPCLHQHHAKVDGLGGFVIAVILPFFVAGAVDGVGVAVNALSDAALGTAGAAAFFLFFFVLAMADGIMGGRVGGTTMTLFLLPADSAM